MFVVMCAIKKNGITLEEQQLFNYWMSAIKYINKSIIFVIN